MYPTRLSTFDAYLITKIGNRNLKDAATGASLWYEVKFGAKILPAYSPLDIKVKQQLQ